MMTFISLTGILTLSLILGISSQKFALSKLEILLDEQFYALLSLKIHLIW